MWTTHYKGNRASDTNVDPISKLQNWKHHLRRDLRSKLPLKKHDERTQKGTASAVAKLRTPFSTGHVLYVSLTLFCCVSI